MVLWSVVVAHFTTALPGCLWRTGTSFSYGSSAAAAPCGSLTILTSGCLPMLAVRVAGQPSSLLCRGRGHRPDHPECGRWRDGPTPMEQPGCVVVVDAPVR